MSICVYGLKRSGSTNIGRPLIAPYRFKKCDNLQIPYISFVVHRVSPGVYDKIQNKVPKNKFVVRSCFCMKEMW